MNYTLITKIFVSGLFLLFVDSVLAQTSVLDTVVITSTKPRVEKSGIGQWYGPLPNIFPAPNQLYSADVRSYSPGFPGSASHIFVDTPAVIPENSRRRIIFHIVFDTSFYPTNHEYGYGITQVSWTPNSQYFVFTMCIFDSIQTKRYATYFYSTHDGKLHNLDQLLGLPTISDLTIAAPDSIYIYDSRTGDKIAKVGYSLDQLLNEK